MLGSENVIRKRLLFRTKNAATSRARMGHSDGEKSALVSENAKYVQYIYNPGESQSRHPGAVRECIRK